MDKESEDEKNSVKGELSEELQKVSAEVTDFLRRRYPISMSLIGRIFGKDS